MIFLKVTTVFLLALSVGAEKKIELQDIEEDNLKSEKQSEVHKSDERPQFSGTGSLPGFQPLDLLKNNLLRYFTNPPTPHQAQQQRYVHQYAVTESPERSSAPTQQYSPPTGPQQAMVGYLSNIPMQIYLVPQYYTDQTQQQINHQSSQVNSQYQPAGIARAPGYPTAPEAVQTQTNYIEVPAYVTSAGKTYVQQYTPPVTYVGYPAQPTNPPTQAAVTPVVTYQVPVIDYAPTIVQPTSAPKPYYSNTQYTDTNSVDEVQGREDEQRQYSTKTEFPYQKPISEFPRHYNSRVPIRDEYRPIHSNTITELPHPNPILLRGAPSHLAHIPKALPIYRPLTKPVYQGGSNHVTSPFTPRPHEVYGPPYKRRPTSLLDSYIPSSIQVEYLKRGLIKEPGAVYEALARGNFPHLIPRHYERGFLPNQMYHTGAGGVTYGHFKRTPKVDKLQK